MYTTAFFAILAGSALAMHPVQELMKRQTLTPDIIPAECQDTCASALPIYNACLSNDQATCLSVCDPENFDSFVGCFNCLITAVPGAASADFQQAQAAIGDIEAACQELSGTSLSAPGISTGSGASGSASATGAGASFTSASSAIVIGGSSAIASASSAVGGASSAAASRSASVAATSAPSASGSGAPAATSSPNAGILNTPQGVAALILGAIGALAL